MIAAAVSLLQSAWREKSVLSRRNCQTSDNPDASDSMPVCGDQGELGTISGDTENVLTNTEMSPPVAPALDPVLERQESGVDAGGFDDCLTPRSTAVASQLSSSSTASPLGMMTVRVKIGSDERSLVTPIVMRESDQKTSEAPAGTGRSTGTGDNDGRQRGELSPKTSAAAGPVSTTGVPHVVENHFTVTDGIQPFVGHSHKPAARWEEKEAKTVKAEASAVNAAYPDVYHAVQNYTDKPYQAIIPRAIMETRQITAKEEATPLPSLVSQEIPFRAMHGGLDHETPTSARSHDQCTSRSATFAAEKPQEEHYFMEDSQVYLGCALCGLNYLVESVNPRLPESGQGKVLASCITIHVSLRRKM